MTPLLALYVCPSVRDIKDKYGISINLISDGLHMFHSQIIFFQDWNYDLKARGMMAKDNPFDYNPNQSQLYWPGMCTHTRDLTRFALLSVC